jgi:hypothetical protein
LNLKGFAAERAEREGAASDKTQPAGDKKGNQKKERDPENQQSLTGLLLGFLAKPDDGSGEERPVIRTPEDYYALVDEDRRRAGALPEPAPAEKNERRVSQVGLPEKLPESASAPGLCARFVTAWARSSGGRAMPF